MSSGTRVAVVTGAAKGIGRGIALALARTGIRTIAADRDDGALQSLLKVNSESAAFLTIRKLDITDTAAIDGFFQAIQEDVGPPEILVNCAGVTRKIDFFELTDADIDWINAVNIRGTMLMMQAGARIMRTRGAGSIINVSSIAGKGFRETTNMAYAASKGAIVIMSRIAAAKLGEFGITVNSICPGMTETEMMRDWMEKTAAARGCSLDDTRRDLVSSVPLQRVNTVDDIAGTVLFLISPAARNITGQSINIDGGLMWD